MPKHFDEAYLAIREELLKPQHNYVAAKEQSQFIDGMLGFACDEIENQLIENNPKTNPRVQQFWYGLDIQSLQTPYSEIVEMVDYLKPKDGEVWMDLGAGYGRMGVVLGFLNPNVKFIGYEFVDSRVQEGNRIFAKWRLLQSQLIKKNIASFEFQLESADLYFIYDFGSQKDIYDILEKLRLIAVQKSIRVIARGRGVKNWVLMDFPWLHQIQSPVHFAHWSLFRS